MLYLVRLVLFLLCALGVVAATPASAAPVVLDDSDSGFRVINGANRRTTEPYSFASRAVLGTDTFSTVDDSSPLTTFAWYFSKLPPGRYSVYATWPARSDAAIDALFMIQTADGKKGRFIDQTKAPTIAKEGRLWTELETVNVRWDGALDVKLSTNFLSGQFALADAVLVERMGDVPVTPAASVPSPWTGIVNSDLGKRAQTFNSAFTLGSGPLPALTIGDASFGRPELVITQNGVQTVMSSPSTIDLSRPDAVALHGTVPIVNGEVVWQATLEYDNFYRVTATIIPSSLTTPVLIEDLQFRWAVPEAEAILVGAPGIGGHAYSYDPESTLLPFLRGEQDQWSTYFGQSTAPGRRQPPVLWLGSARRGVAWQADSDENFSYDHLPSSFGFQRLMHFERDRQQKTITMRVNMIRRAESVRVPAVAVRNPLRFSFAIQATPVRPENLDLRGFLAGAFTGQADSSNIYGWGGSYFTGDSGSSIPPGTSSTSPPLSNHISWYPGGLFPYSGSWWVHSSLGASHVDWWKTLNQQPLRSGADNTELYVSPSSMGWRSRYMAEAQRLLSYPYVSGMYVDVNHLETSDNRANKDFVVDDWGRVLYGNWQLTAQRDFMKELYLLHAQAGKKLFVHQHNDDVPAIHGWGHLSLPGEDSYHRIGTNPLSYIEDTKFVTVTANNPDRQRLVGYPLSYWQSLKRMGTYPIFLNQYARASGGVTADGQHLVSVDQNNSALVRGLIAMLGLHDIGLYGTWALSRGDTYGHTEGLAYNNLMKRWRGAKFYGYWEQTRFRASDPRLLISYYERPNGGLLIWLTNRSPQPLAATVNNSSVTVPPGDFRFLETTDLLPPAAPSGMRLM